MIKTTNLHVRWCLHVWPYTASSFSHHQWPPNFLNSILTLKIVENYIAHDQNWSYILCPTLPCITFLTIFKENTHTCQRIAFETGVRENSKISSKYHQSKKLARVENQFLMKLLMANSDISSYTRSQTPCTFVLNLSSQFFGFFCVLSHAAEQCKSFTRLFVVSHIL